MLFRIKMKQQPHAAPVSVCFLRDWFVLLFSNNQLTGNSSQVPDPRLNTFPHNSITVDLGNAYIPTFPERSQTKNSRHSN